MNFMYKYEFLYVAYTLNVYVYRMYLCKYLCPHICTYSRMCIFVYIHKYMYVVLVYICSMCKRVYEYYRCKIESIREWKLIEEWKCEIMPRSSF